MPSPGGHMSNLWKGREHSSCLLTAVSLQHFQELDFHVNTGQQVWIGQGPVYGTLPSMFWDHAFLLKMKKKEGKHFK